jgi:hypothetical protein
MPKAEPCHDLHLGLHYQRQQQQDRGLEGQQLGCGERAEGVEKHDGLADLPMLVA